MIQIILAMCCFLFAFLLICGFKKADSWNTNLNNELNEFKGIKYEDKTLRYLGGFPTIEGDKPCTIEIREREIALDMCGNSRLIVPNRIKNVRIITKEQLQQQINLGKFILFGWLALAMKDSKIKAYNFLEIEYNNGTEDLKLLFTSEKLETTCYELRKKVNIE